MTVARIEELVSLNVSSPMQLTRACLPALRAQGSGRLLFVTSIAGAVGVPGENVYSATKAAIEMFADVLRVEVRDEGISVGSLVLGVVDTDFFVARGAPYDRSFPRLMPVDRVAAAAVGLLGVGPAPAGATALARAADPASRRRAGALPRARAAVRLTVMEADGHLRHRMRLGRRYTWAWRPTGARGWAMVRSLATSYLALGTTLYILPGRQSSGPLAVFGLVLAVAVVGLLLRPVLAGLALVLGSFGLLLLGVVYQAIVLDVAISFAPDLDIRGRAEVVLVSWVARRRGCAGQLGARRRYGGSLPCAGARPGGPGRPPGRERL